MVHTHSISTATRIVALCLLAVLLIPVVALAYPANYGITQDLNYQGILKDSSGNTVADGSYAMVFKLYTAASGGTAIWTGSYTVTVTNGLFSVLLGSGTGNSLDGVNFNQSPLYLGITVGTDSEMTPRLELGAAPYAFNADQVDGLSFATTSAYTSGNALYVDANGKLDATSSLTILSSGYIGIGTSTPAGALQITHVPQGDSALVIDQPNNDTAIDTKSGLYLTNTDPTTGNWGVIGFGVDPLGSPAAKIGVQYIDRTNDYGELVFATRDVSGMTERMRITSAGDVGIGTTTPQRELTVVSNDTNPPLGLESTQSNGYSGMHLFDMNGTLVGHMGYANTGASAALADSVYFGSIAGKKVNFTTSDAVRMTIDASGNVGIGTSSPIAPLTVMSEASPTKLSSVDQGSLLTGYPLDVQGQYAYVPSYNSNQLLVFNISDPSAPTLVGSASTDLNEPSDVQVVGKYAYVASYGNDRLVVFDISDPAAPTAVGYVNMGVGIQWVRVQGRYAYTSSGLSGSSVAVVDTANPSAPTVVATSASGLNRPEGIAVSGRYLYVISELNSTLVIYDISDPTKLTLVGSISTQLNYGNDVTVAGGYAYVADDSQLVIFNVSDPTSPSLVGYATGGISEATNVVVQGRYAYVDSYGNSELKVFDVSNPAAPALLSSASTGAPLRGLVVDGRYAYTTSNKLEIFDLGGAYLQQAQVGGLQTGSLSVLGNVQAAEGIFSDGLNVGQSLAVNGAVVINASTSASQKTSIFTIRNATSSAPFQVLYDGNVGVGTSSPWGRFSADTSNLTAGEPSFVIGSSTRTDLVVLQNGNVGIGTTIPGDALDVNGSIGFGSPAFAPDGSAASPAYAFGNDHTTGLFRDGSSLAFSTAAAERLAITSSGDVGVGTSTPYAGLTLWGSSSTSGNALEIANSASTTIMTVSNAGMISVGNDTGEASGIFTIDASSSTTTIANLSTGNLTFDTDAGVVMLSDIPVDSNAASGVPQSQSIGIGGTQVLTVYGTADGAGNATDLGVGIGTTTPSYALDVATSSTGAIVARFTNGTGSCTIDPTSGSVGCSSDERLKKNILSLDASTTLSGVLGLDPVTYNWKTEATSSPTHTGFIAQEVQKIFPDLVATDTASGYLTLNYAGFVPYIVSAFQSLEKEVTSFADQFTTKELCLSDTSGQTCITRSQLDQLLSGSSSQSISSNASITSDTTSTPPVLTVNGNDPATVSVGTAYSDLGATITGPQQDLDLGIVASVDGATSTPVSSVHIDTSVAGVHTIEYSVTDQSGLIGTASRTVKVIAATSTSAGYSNASSTPSTKATTASTTVPSSTSASSSETSASSTAL